jgi:hypothetical protein
VTTERPLFELNPEFDVENQVDAMFAPLYSLIPTKHHAAIVNVERDMINALKSAMRSPATEPLLPDPSSCPYDAWDRLRPFFSATQQRAVIEARKRSQPN